MPFLNTIPPISFVITEYGGRENTAVGYFSTKKGNYKARCETIIFNNENKIHALLTNKPWKYEFSGGTVELPYDEYLNNPPIIDLLTSTARRETLEEAGLVIYDHNFTHIYRYYDMNENALKDTDVNIVGALSFIFTAKCTGSYMGKIESEDEYPEMRKKSKFYSYKEIKNILEPEHRQIIEKYIKDNPILTDKERQNKSLEKLKAHRADLFSDESFFDHLY
jgi:hypothetical protein